MMNSIHRIATLAIAGALACGREGATHQGSGGLRIALDTARGATSATVVVAGLAPEELRALRSESRSMSSWQQLLTVSVSGSDDVAIAGRYAVSDTSIEFHPLYPFDPGRSYSVRFDGAQLPTPHPDTIVTASVMVPRIQRVPSTWVARVTPTADVLPENLLRVYVEFSAPMSRRGGLDFVKLVDEAGREVRGAFLPLEADFWNADRTRYTLFFDPGRVKRGILPNEQMGRALRAGATYTLDIEPRWNDADGLPLAAPYRRTFRVGPADETPIVLASWRIQSPQSGTTDPLVVTFPEPLDHGLLERALGVEGPGGRALTGTISIDRGETEWRFTPPTPWRRGAHHLLVLSILEDVAGNRIGRAFEVDSFEQVDTTAAPERALLPFVVR